MSLTVAELRALFTVDDSEVDDAVAGLPGKVRKAAPAMKAAGAAVGTALAVGLADNLSIEQDTARLTAQMNLTGPQAARAGKIAAGLYRDNFGESIGGVNDALRSVVQNMNVDIGDADLSPITGQVISLSETFDQDLGATTRAAGQLMRTGLASNAQEALDIIARGFQNGADKSEDYLDTLNEYGTQFRKLGIDGTTATGLISQGLKAGARDGDIVADAIKEFSIRAVDGSTTTAAGFKALGLSAKDVNKQIARGDGEQALGKVIERLRAIKDPAKQAQVATMLFGTQAEDLGQALFALDTDTAAQGMGDVAGAAKKVADTVGGTNAGRLETWKRRIRGMADDAAATLGPYGAAAGALAGYTQSALGMLAPLAQLRAAKVAETAATGAQTTAENTSRVATLRATASAVASRVASIAVSAATKAWAAGQWLLNAALTANPIGLVVVAIAALVGGLIVAYKKSETFRAVVQGVASAVVGYFKLMASFWLGVVSGILGGLSTLLGALGHLPGKMGAPFRAAKGAIDDAKGAVDRLRGSINATHGKNVRVSVTTPGADRAIDKLAALRWQQDHIDPTVTVRAYVRANKAGFNALGTNSWRGGPTWVGERGPELIDLPSGTRITPNSKSSQMRDRYGEHASQQQAAPGQGGGPLFTVDRVELVRGGPDEVARDLVYELRSRGM